MPKASNILEMLAVVAGPKGGTIHMVFCDTVCELHVLGSVLALSWLSYIKLPQNSQGDMCSAEKYCCTINCGKD